jgi:hypothetical protein
MVEACVVASFAMYRSKQRMDKMVGLVMNG